MSPTTAYVCCASRGEICAVLGPARTSRFDPDGGAKAPHPERIVSHHFALSDGAAAYKTFAERKPGTGKVILTVIA
jgi:hypothetical protein